MAELKFRRILLKLGGEALAGEGGFGINPSQADFLAQKVVNIINMGVQARHAGWHGPRHGASHG
jgi:uridylate kinase